MNIVKAPTATVTIFIAGDFAVAKQVCREFVFAVGLCVTCEPTCYIYTGGEEAGVRIGLINYPRFPTDEAKLRSTAEELGELLMVRLCQHSFTVQSPTETLWFTRRPS